MNHSSRICGNKRRLTAVLLFLLAPSIGFADCYVTWNCGGSAQCAQLYGASSGQRGPFPSCAGWVKRDADSSCTCGASNGATMPAGGDPASQLGKIIGNALWQGLTAPAQPKMPEQIEAERQAEVLRQQQEAERQAKIQKYLNDEADKLKQKNSALDQEAQDSLSLLDHKPVAMSDAELLGSKNDKMAPSVCTTELEGLSSDLNSFADEAQKEGMQFAANDALKTTRQSMNDLGGAAVAKMGMKQYAEDYKILKGEVDKVKKDAGYISEIKKCVGTRGCSLIELSKKYDQEFKEWVKGLGTQGLKEAADRVDKAAAFYSSYTMRLEQHNEKIINGAAKCIAN